MNDESFMREALKLAKESFDSGEVPVGAVVVKDGLIVGKGKNNRETGRNAVNHAEIEAISEACKNIGSWRLHGCSLYVTLEPCPMCAGAVINSRIDKVFFGAYDKKAGSVRSVVRLFDLPFNHEPEVTGGLLENECSSLLSAFFEKLRK